MTGRKAPLGRAIIDRFCCPEEFVNFGLQGQLSEEAGFFRFGSSICYGRTSCGTPSRDVSSDVLVENSEVLLPFDPTEVIENLRWERYVRPDSRFRALAKEMYYALRQFLPLGTRKFIQRAHARGWNLLTFPHWPIDTTVEDLCQSLMQLSIRSLRTDKVPFIWFWPDGARSCVLMTHDVDTKVGMDYCQTLMDIDDAFGVKAAFLIVPEDRYIVPDGLVATIRNRGFEVGVQDLNHDGRLFDDRDEFLQRADRINQHGRRWAARGFRSAVLYRRPDWFGALDFDFDMSLPNVAHLDPQRGGCCTVMPYFIGNILELPVTTTQDYMLLNLLNHHSIDLWKTQFETIHANNGLASFIVHPDYIAEPNARLVYEALLGYLHQMRQKENIWFALPSAIDQWWRRRSKMNLIPDGDGWRIEGEGAEHAVLAYARVAGNQLVYDLQMATV